MSTESLTTLATNAAPVDGLTFDNESLEDALIQFAQFNNCRFSSCSFDYATLQACKFYNCRFENCSMRETVFEDCHFCEDETGTQWRYCNLSKAVFQRSNLSLNQFIGCEAYKIELEECAAQGTTFDLDVHRKIASQTMPGGMQVDKCKLQYASFSGADLSESRLESSDLREVNFSGCNLSNASLRGSALNNADFHQSILDGASLAHATFDEIDFADMASHHRVIVSRDQHENILATMGIVTLN